jgi:hypothetical protein
VHISSYKTLTEDKIAKYFKLEQSMPKMLAHICAHRGKAVKLCVIENKHLSNYMLY